MALCSNCGKEIRYLDKRCYYCDTWTDYGKGLMTRYIQDQSRMAHSRQELDDDTEQGGNNVERLEH